MKKPRQLTTDHAALLAPPKAGLADFLRDPAILPRRPPPMPKWGGER